LLTQPLLDNAMFFQLNGKQHLRRNRRRIAVKLLDKFGNHFLIGFILRPFHNEIFLADQFPVSNIEQLNTGFFFRARNGYHIRIGIIITHDFLLFDYPINSLNLISQGGSPFKVQILRGIAHLLLEPVYNVGGFPLQKRGNIFHHRIIIRLRDCIDTRTRTKFNIIVQARSTVLTGDLPITGQIREDTPQQIQCLMHRPNTGIRAEISRPILNHLAGNQNPRVRILKFDFNIRIAFIVFELNIVLRPILFNQIHFKNQRFQLGFHHNPVDMINMTDHLAGFYRMLHTVLKIGTDPVTQIDRFTDINDFVIGVFHQITTGFIRQRL